MQDDNRRIAKNTLLLYFRMLFLSGISFFTVRIILDALGVVNYGIMNVVSSVISSLTFVTGTLSTATQRYFSFYLGKNDTEGYKKIFSLIFLCYSVMGVAVICIGELFGYFFLEDWLNIPTDRLYAAKWVFQTSLLSFILQLITVPFNASIIAHERMSVFAYISIFDAIGKLVIAYLLYMTSADRLIFYGILTAGVNLLILLCYVFFCKINFAGCRLVKTWERGLFKELLGFTGWNLFGSLSGTLNTQGQSILLNIYFGPVINTAKGIADKIANIIQSFSSNFFVAVSPQIVKSYASGETDRTFYLVIKSSKFSFFLLLVFAYPLILITPYVLTLWLGQDNVSTDMFAFTRLSLIYCLVCSLEPPITQMIRATGNIKRYQIAVGCITLLFIPISALFLYLHYPPYTTMYVLISIYVFVQWIRVYIAYSQLEFPRLHYFRETVFPILTVCAMLFVMAWPICRFAIDTLTGILLRGAISFIAVCVFIIAFGLTGPERQIIKKKILAKIHK